MSCNNLGCWSIWIGVQRENVPVKNNTCLFFHVSKGLFSYLYFYSYWWSWRFPLSVFKSEMTHPHPSSAINSQKIGPNETCIAFWEIRPPFCPHVTWMTKHNFPLGFATGSPMMIATPNTIVSLLHCSIFCRLSFVWLSSPSQSINYAHYQWWMHWGQRSLTYFGRE